MGDPGSGLPGGICLNGHEVLADDLFCPECGLPVAKDGAIGHVEEPAKGTAVPIEAAQGNRSKRLAILLAGAAVLVAAIVALQLTKNPSVPAKAAKTTSTAALPPAVQGQNTTAAAPYSSAVPSTTIGTTLSQPTTGQISGGGGAVERCGMIDVLGGETAEVTVTSGVSCSTALQITDSYWHHPPSQPQGSGAYVQIGEWFCGHSTYSERAQTGLVGTCTGPGTITMSQEPGSATGSVTHDPSVPPSTAKRTYHVNGSGGGLVIRTSPSVSAAQVGMIPEGATVTVSCITRGDNVSGPFGDDSWWDRVTYAGTSGWVTDQYMDTRNDVNDQSLLARC